MRSSFSPRALLTSVLLPVVLACPCAAPAQPPGPKVRLLFGRAANDPTPKPDFFVRPNAEQAVFVFVQNDDDRPRTVTVQLLEGTRPLLATAAPVAVKDDGAPHPVALAKVAAPAPPGPAAPPKPEEAKGPLAFRLLDEKGEPIGGPVPVEVARPGRYLAPPLVRYFPPSRDHPVGRLVARVRVREEFAGPPCRVELVVRPERIPGLVPGQKKEGVYAGLLAGKRGEELVLVAEGLRFAGTATYRGPVYLTVDGYERAFTFFVSFPPTGTPATPIEVNRPGLFLDAPAFALPDKPLKVRVEVDNAPRGARTTLEVRTRVLVERDEGLVLEESHRVAAEYFGDRRQSLLVSAAEGGGALFKTVVTDWDLPVDLGVVHGPAVLRLRLFDESDRLLEVRDGRTGELAERREVRHVVKLDGQLPDARFVDPPRGALPGEVLVLRATTDDLVGEIERVDFFLGRAGPEGQPPQGAELVPGRLADARRRVWVAELAVSRERKDAFDVGVRFVKKAGPSAGATVKVDIDDPAKRRKASVRGRVLEGDRVQVGLEVGIQDARGELKGTARTNDKGVFEFKDLDPGVYRLGAYKRSSATRGLRTIELKPGENKVLTEKEEIKLYR